MAHDVARRRRAELLTFSYIAWLMTRDSLGPEELEKETIALLQGWGLKPQPHPTPPPGEIVDLLSRTVGFIDEMLQRG